MEYAQLFALNYSKLGFTDVIQHTIDTGDSQPLCQLPRRIPFALHGKVEEMVEDMLELGVGQPNCLGSQEGGHNSFLHGLSPTQCSHQDGCVSIATGG